ncbi:MAG: hypothetical protein IKP47_04050 [Ruminococcus sp.]|nr:hypothetical protein [Ruminococcus sp.]
MNENNETSTKAGIIFLLTVVLYIVWGSAAFAAIVVFMLGLVNGEFIYCGICGGGLVVWVIITRVWSKYHEKKRKEQEQEYKAANVDQYVSDGGRLGTLTFEYDRPRKLSVLATPIPVIFAETEPASFVSCRERENGRLVEYIVDRLTADSAVLINGIMQVLVAEFNEQASIGLEIVWKEPSAILLCNIAVIDNGTCVECEFLLTGLEMDVYATVAFAPTAEGYNFMIQRD